MQFHLDGYRFGDPALKEPSAHATAARPPDRLPAEVDVLIVGCGPAGLTLAAQLSAFPEIRTAIVDQKYGPLQLGQADGVACRTMEMFQAFGFREEVEREAYWVNETTFWRPDPNDASRIVRHGRVQDVEDGLSDFPHVILNQARVHEFYLEKMRNSPNRLVPNYGRRLVGLDIDTTKSADMAAYPVTASFERGDVYQGGFGQPETIRAKYVVGCDGARSVVRQALGRSLQGDAANQAWGVMDVLAVTTFPDIRMKSLIQSAGEGSIVLIPREGGYLVRIYVELDKLRQDERITSKNITIEKLIAAAQRIFHPYTLDVKEVAWWSVYEIGQRLTDKFDDVPAADVAVRLPRVFIAGDACHTHSPKAGQGMNVSMQDTFNLGWKLAAVLRHQAKPALLHSYSAERQAIAKNLIDFDREWAAMLSAPLKSASNPKGVDPADVQTYFVKHGHYTAGTATKYTPSTVTGRALHQALATGFEIGTRFHSAPVVRLADGKPQRLGDTLLADGRWRLLAFADNQAPAAPSSRVRALCDFLFNAETSPVLRYTPASADIDAVIDVRFVLQQGFRDVRLDGLPAQFLPAKGRYGLRDYEKVFCPDVKSGRDIYALRGIDRARGAIVLVRPDQYVAHILPLDGYAGLSEYFDAFMIPAR